MSIREAMNTEQGFKNFTALYVNDIPKMNAETLSILYRHNTQRVYSRGYIAIAMSYVTVACHYGDVVSAGTNCDPDAT